MNTRSRTAGFLIPILLFWAAHVRVACSSDNPGGFNFHWARSGGGSGADEVRGVAVDRYGQVHVAGAVQGPQASFGNIKLTPQGLDAFVALYDHSGGLLWAHTAGGTGQDSALGAATDSQGNSIMAGYARVNALFGDVALTNAGGADSFVAKYDQAGSLRWVRGAGGASDDRAWSVSADPADNIYVAGEFRPGASFGGTTITNHGGFDAWVGKYDPDGNLLWARSGGGVGEDSARAVAADPNGGVLVAGYFTGQAFFDSATLTAVGTKDVFLVKYDALGNVVWARSGGSAGEDFAKGVAVDSDGGVVVTGKLPVGDAVFGGITLTGAVARTFVARYDNAGTIQWARGAGGSESTSVAIRDGDAFVLGDFSFSAQVGTNRLTSAGSVDVSLARYRRDGELEWARAIGGTNTEASSALALDDRGGVVVAGQYQVSTTLDSLALTSIGAGDVFVGRISPEPLVSAATPASLTVPPESDASFSITAQGGSPLQIQWYHDGLELVVGQTNAVLTLTNVDVSRQGLYQAVATNVFGAVTSAPSFLNVSGLPLPRVLVNGVRATSFDFTNTLEVEVSLQVGLSGASLYYTTNGAAPNLASTRYTGPFKIGGSRVIRAIAFDAELSSSQTPPIPINFYLGAPRITVDGETGALFTYSNRPSVLVAMGADLPNTQIRYSLDGSALGTNSPLYSSPFVVTQSLTLRAYSSLAGMISATSAPVTISLFSLYPLSFLPISDGVVTVLSPPGGGPYEAGKEIRIAATPSPGWSFVSWTGDASGTNDQLLLLMDRPRQVGALFGTPLSIVNIGAGQGQVAVDPVLPMYTRGAVLKMWAVPRDGSFFARWSGAGIAAGTNNPSTFTIQNIAPNLSAIFSPLADATYAVTSIPSSQGTTLVEPALPYYTNKAEVLLTATPSANLRFSRWEIDLASSGQPGIVTNANPYRLLVTNSFIVHAIYGSRPVLVEPTITFQSTTNKADDPMRETDQVVFVKVTSDPGVTLSFQVSSNRLDGDPLAWTTFKRVVNKTGNDQFQIWKNTATNSVSSADTRPFADEPPKYFRVQIE